MLSMHLNAPRCFLLMNIVTQPCCGGITAVLSLLEVVSLPSLSLVHHIHVLHGYGIRER